MRNWMVVFERIEWSYKMNCLYTKEKKVISLDEAKRELTPKQFYKLDYFGTINTKYGNYYLKRVD